MKKIDLSIIIPTYNEESNIKNCLEGVFKQKYSGEVEVLVVDGGSTDKTVEIARKYPVRIVKNPQRLFLTGKMIGFKQSKGEYFTYLDADIDLPTTDWISKMIKPLADDKNIIGSFTKYVSYPQDSNLNKYLTLDPLQRDPLFIYLTPSIDSLVIEKRLGYLVCQYKLNKMLPQGLCVYRRKELLIPEITERDKFHELDNLVILTARGWDKFAYVPDTGLHHITVKDLKMLIKKRVRNLEVTFFDTKMKHYWTWIDFSNKQSIYKLIIWLLYAETFILPLIVGVFKCLKYKTWLGLYEPVVVWLTTNIIILTFLKSTQGKKIISQLWLGQDKSWT